MYVSVYVWVGACRGQKRALDSLKPELQAVVSYRTWVLETEFESSPTAPSALTY